MNRVILQPASSKDAQEHFKNTIENPVDLEVIKNFVEELEYQTLVDIYGKNSKIPTWGVTPGESNVNVNKWGRIRVGDVTLFTAKGEIFASGVVTYKIQNRDIANQLWGNDAKGQTWEYIYFLDEIKKLSIPYINFNRVAGYKDNYVVQSFNVLDEKKSEQVLSAFNLMSDVYLPDVTEEEYSEIISKFNTKDNLDKRSVGIVRSEQSFLRKHLFGRKKVGRCGICNQEYPVQYLWAAHIKKRSECTNEEKLDYKNIVMPMCKFGCDELYEKGEIAVKDGKVVRTKATKTTLPVEQYIQKIIGNRCEYWNENSAPYFLWHYEKNIT